MVTFILGCLLIGAIFGCLACLAIYGNLSNCWTTIAVGIVGAMLGLAAHFGMGEGGLIDFAGCEYVAGATGALLALGLWCVAQKLFLAKPTTLGRNDSTMTR